MPDLIEYAFVGVSLSDANVMGEDYSNESHNKSNYLHHHLKPPKKHVLNYSVLEMAAFVVA